jgi:hypothetical protein
LTIAEEEAFWDWLLDSQTAMELAYVHFGRELIFQFGILTEELICPASWISGSFCIAIFGENLEVQLLLHEAVKSEISW